MLTKLLVREAYSHGGAQEGPLAIDPGSSVEDTQATNPVGSEIDKLVNKVIDNSKTNVDKIKDFLEEKGEEEDTALGIAADIDSGKSLNYVFSRWEEDLKNTTLGELVTYLQELGLSSKDPNLLFTQLSNENTQNEYFARDNINLFAIPGEDGIKWITRDRIEVTPIPYKERVLSRNSKIFVYKIDENDVLALDTDSELIQLERDEFERLFSSKSVEDLIDIDNRSQR